MTRTDERGKVTTWYLTVRHLVPQAQSVGTFVSWAKAPNGRTVTDYDALTILDVGGGDLQQTDITLKPSYRMSSERRGDGTIDIARGLKQLLPKAKFNDVTAQYALITRQALISGKMQKIEKEVVSVINSYGQDLVGKMLEIVQETRREHADDPASPGRTRMARAADSDRPAGTDSIEVATRQPVRDIHVEYAGALTIAAYSLTPRATLPKFRPSLP